MNDIRQRYAAQAASPTASVVSPDTVAATVKPRPLGSDRADAELEARVEGMRPSDVLPMPSNEVGSLDEALSIEKGRFAPVRSPDEMQELGSR